MSLSTSTQVGASFGPSGVESSSPHRPAASLSLLRRARNALPTMVVFGVLAGVSAWGYRSDWTLPKFSALLGAPPTTEQLWCDEHNVPEQACLECNPALRPHGAALTWCKVHGVYGCPLEQPDIAQLKVVPTVTPDMLQRAERALALLPRPENNSRCRLHETIVQFASIEAMDKVGVQIDIVKERRLVEALQANGEVIYDQTHAAHLASRVAGTVWRVAKQVGDKVAAGDVLALIDSADVGRAKNEFLQAIAHQRLKQKTLERLEPLSADGSVPGKLIREAEAALEEAKIRLKGAQQSLVNLGLPLKASDFVDRDLDSIVQAIQFLGLPNELSAELDAETTTSNLFPLRTPLEGVVTDRKIVAGEVVDMAQALFSVADLRQMWLMLDVRQDDARYLALGQNVLFQESGANDAPPIKGALAWISTEADHQTRTVKVRVNLPNPGGKLRANTFGSGRIVLREEAKAVFVPSEAVHWDGTCFVVFVRDKNFLQTGAAKFFHVRSVRPGVKQDGLTEIIAGLLPGEIIAAKNSVVLEAQLLKGNLGAGCGCVDGV